jgi:hypothetical protein
MASTLERIGRKSLALRNRLIKPQADEIQHLVEMMQTSPRGYSDAQDWALQLASLLERNLLDRVSRKDLALILAGLVSYRNTGVTPQRSHIALMQAYENSSGLMQQMLHTILFSEKIEKVRSIKSDFFGDVYLTEIDAILSELDERGYVVLPQNLQKRWVDALVSEAKKFSYTLRNPASDEAEISNRKIDPDNPPRCVAAYAKSSDVAASQLFNDFCNDPLLLHLASRHMDAKVHSIDSTLWYSFSSSEPSADAAQLFHYDLDTLRWLKVFVYLTDVGPDNGPHEYVPGSHKPGAKPVQLMNRDYARLSDQEVDEYCARPRKSICGERGTVILGDTRCFHKGNAVSSGYRLIFSPIYAASKIGYFHGS